MSVALVPTPQPVFKVLKIERIIDGDTCEVVLDKWHGEMRKIRVRFLEIDTPEKKDLERWQWAKDFTSFWLAEALVQGQLYCEGHRMDSFGRLLGYMWNGVNAEGLSYLLAANGLGKKVPLHQHLKALGAVS